MLTVPEGSDCGHFAPVLGQNITTVGVCHGGGRPLHGNQKTENKTGRSRGYYVPQCKKKRKKLLQSIYSVGPSEEFVRKSTM